MMPDQKLEQVQNRLDAHGPVCYDAETSGLNYYRNAVVGHVFSFGPSPQDSYYLPFRHGGGGNLFGLPGLVSVDSWDRKPHPLEVELMGKLRGKLVFGHNLAFDLKFMVQVGYRLDAKRHEDTIINAPLLDEWQGKFSLEFCANSAGVAAKKASEIQAHINKLFPETAGDRNYMGHFWRLAGDDPMAVSYAEGDGTTTWQLRDWQMVELEKQELMRVHDVESRLIPVLARMTLKGVKIDEERLGWLKDTLDGQIKELLRGFGKDEFNARSSGDVKEWCERHGETDWPLTQKKLAPSFPESWLETHEPGKKIIAVRRLTTLRDSFVIPLQEHHLVNGRVHTSFNQLRGDEYGTITGRLSSSEPNLQQVPKRNYEIGRLFRSVFIPDYGMLWGSDDFSQCEPRLLAYYSRAAVLLRGYLNTPEVDAHTAVTVSLYPHWPNLSKDDPNKKRLREDGKRLNQLLLTGGGKAAMARKYHITEQAAAKLFNDYFKRLPEVKRLQGEATPKMRKRGFVRDLLGRKARLNDPSKDYHAVNRLLQCGNASILKAKLVEIDDYLESEGRPLDILINIHDAFESQFPDSARKQRNEMLRIAQDFTSDHTLIKLLPVRHPDTDEKMDLPIKIEPGEGANWAKATYGDDA